MVVVVVADWDNGGGGFLGSRMFVAKSITYQILIYGYAMKFSDFFSRMLK